MDIRLILEWFAIIILTISPIVALLLKKKHGNIESTEENPSLFHYAVIAILGISMLIICARFDLAKAHLDSIFVQGYVYSKEILDTSGDVDVYENKTFFEPTYSEDQWKVDIINIYLIVMLIGFPAISCKLLGVFKKDKNYS